MEYTEKVLNANESGKRQNLISQGWTRGQIEAKRGSGEIVSIRAGRYALPGNDRVALQIHLEAGGVKAALASKTAAELHGLDVRWKPPAFPSMMVPHELGLRKRNTIQLVRIRRAREITEVDGLRVITRAETVIDLAGELGTQKAAILLESALRGCNPMRPEDWRVEVLADLHRLVGGDRRRKGVATIRALLADRPVDGRPTGSAEETQLVLALRAIGVEVICQPTVYIIDSQGRKHRYFPDLLIVIGKLIIEVDGKQHTELERWRRDLQRNIRLTGFTLFRYPTTRIRTELDVVVSEIVDHLAQVADEAPVLQDGLYRWQQSGRRVEGSGNEWTITASTAAQRVSRNVRYAKTPLG